MSGNPERAEPVIARPGVEIWLGTPDAASHFDLATLTAAERERFAAIRGPRRREEFKISRALRAHARTRFQGAAGSAVESLSHSGGYAAFAMASGLLLGIDLEVYRPRDVLRLARNVFSAAEVEALQAAQGARRDHLFHALWTLKEALAKALRLNLMDALRLCTFAVNEGVWSGFAPTRSPWSAVVFAPEENICLAIALLRSPPPLREGRDVQLDGSGSGVTLQTREWPGEIARWPVSARAAAPPADSGPDPDPVPHASHPCRPSSPRDAAVPPATTP